MSIAPCPQESETVANAVPLPEETTTGRLCKVGLPAHRATRLRSHPLPQTSKQCKPPPIPLPTRTTNPLLYPMYYLLQRCNPQTTEWHDFNEQLSTTLPHWLPFATPEGCKTAYLEHGYAEVYLSILSQNPLATDTETNRPGHHC